MFIYALVKEVFNIKFRKINFHFYIKMNVEGSNLEQIEFLLMTNKQSVLIKYLDLHLFCFYVCMIAVS